jgi:HD-like signal output (HDOD) protein
LGLSSYEIAAMMFEHWNFESALTDALRDISNPSTKNPYSQILNVIAKAINLRDPLSERALSEAHEAIEDFGLNRNAFDEAVDTIKAKK